MLILTQRDFETVAGQERIIKSIHQLEAKVHKLELELHKLQQKDDLIDQEFQGPEAY
jgi:hypothetical protein